MRCLSLAAELIRGGDQVEFYSCPLPDHWARLILDAGSGWTVVPEGMEEEEEAAYLDSVMTGKSFDWIVLDHYHRGLVWERRVLRGDAKLLVFEDVPGRQHLADALLDPGWPTDAGAYQRLAPGAELLLGPANALLRQEFLERRPPQGLAGPINSALVCFGGSDPSNQTGKALRALAQEELDRIDVVLSSSHPERARVELLCRQLGAQLWLDHWKMAELLALTDLCIGSAGSACWERCCLGVPALVVLQAENQRRVGEAGHMLGFHQCLGEDGQVSPEQIRRAFCSLKAQPQEVAAMSRNGLAVVDGLGVQRLVLFLRQRVRT